MSVALPLACACCGYDVHGLTADGDCPECGEPIRLTIINVVDPVSKRLIPLHHPIVIGNTITGIVLFYYLSCLLSVLAILVRSPANLPLPDALKEMDASWIVWSSASIGLVALLCVIPLLRLSQRDELQGCRSGILLTGIGLLMWTCSMVLIPLLLLDQNQQTASVSMLIDTIIPVLAGCLVFSGFRRLIPRLGQRSRAFRQAQNSRQRMNDLLVALAVIVVGRTLVAVTIDDSNLMFLGLAIMVMSISLVVIGLGYLLKNVLWIRKALITPPPALSDLLEEN